MSAVKFNADLRLGKQHEQSLGAVLDRQLGDWLEHKFDAQCFRTGNLFVEVEQPDRHNGGRKPSGISTSTADYWAFEFNAFSWLILPTSQVKSVALSTLSECGPTWGGDGRAFKGVLVPIERLVLNEGLWNRVAA